MPNRHATLHPAMAYALAADPGTTTNTLDQLATHREPLIRQLVARHPHTTNQTLLKLAHDRPPLVHQALAERRNTPSPILTTLVQSYTRKRHGHTAPEILTRLAGHRHTPSHDLVRIYKTGRSLNNPTMLVALATNPKAPEALNARGEKVSFIAEGFAATVVQHECDHLMGKLYLDRMTDMSELAFNKEYQKYHADPNSGDTDGE